ncbi:hypothetical protein HNY73_019864 [Argiope bruennichi]|uniref:Uncharacterized protein n=1 Tax=Argiope bruennichi TaxID=94029 RepID=A0A8T0E4S2_ARGBR|nr:hypothetical protein HNY73_019864 [Argiope bruennichi]
MPFYSMPDANTFFLGPNTEENYGEYSDSRFDPQWEPWQLNSQSEIRPFRSNNLNSKMDSYSDYENLQNGPNRNHPHRRNMKHNITLKTKRPSQFLKSHQKSQSNKEDDDYDNNYEDDENIELRRDTESTQLPPNKMIRANRSLEMNRNPSIMYENKRDYGALNNQYLPENSPNSYPGIPEIGNNALKEKSSSNLEYVEPNSDSLRTVDTVTESITDSDFNDNENEDLSSNRPGMQSPRAIYITDEAIGPESITPIYNQGEVLEYKTDTSNYMNANNMQNPGQYQAQNQEPIFNNVNKDEYIDLTSIKPINNLMPMDINTGSVLINDQKEFPEPVKMVKRQRALNRTISSQAAPKLTFYNEIQSSTEFQNNTTTQRSEFTTDENSHLNAKRLTNDKPIIGKNKLHKRPKIKPSKPSSYQHKYGIKDQNLHHDLNQGMARQGGKSDKIHETAKKIFNSNENDRISKHRMKQKQQKFYPQKVNDGSNNENIQKGLKHDFIKNNHGTNLKIKNFPDSKLNKNLGNLKIDLRRDSFQDNASDHNSSKKRSVETRDATTEKGSAIYFKRNFENKHNSSNRRTSKSSSKAIVRSANNFKYRNRIHNYKKQPFQHRKQFPKTPGKLSYKKFLHHKKPHYPHSKHKYPKYKSKGRNQKREPPAYAPPSSFEIKELNEPYNYELNIAKHLNDGKSKVDEKLSRTMEDYKVKKTVLKDGKTHKETDIVENENEKVVDNVHVISDPNQKTTLPSPAPVDTHFGQSEAAYPYIDHEEIGEDENPEEQYDESDVDNLHAVPLQKTIGASVAKAEEVDQSLPENSANENDYEEEESKEKIVSDNYIDTSTDQEAEVTEKSQESSSVEIEATPNEVDINYGSEQSEEEPENYEDSGAYYQTSTEIPPAKIKPMKVADYYLPSADLPPDFSLEQAPMDQIYQASYPPLDLPFQSPEMNGLYQENYELPYGNGKKHKKIYHFSTEYAVSDGLDEFEKEEKLEKASKTVVKNKLMTANESSHHFQEKKTEIKNNKESYHEAYIEEKDENKFPRDMDIDDNLPNSAPTSNHLSHSNSENDKYPDINSEIPENSANDNNSEASEDQELDDQPGKEDSERISQRFSPSDELNQHEYLIDNVKRSQPRLKVNRGANIGSFTNETHVQENQHGGRRDASSLNRQSVQEIHKKGESNFEDSPNRKKEIRDSGKASRGSGTPAWTAPHSESKSGNVVYITMRTTTMDLEKKYHDFIQIQDDNTNSRRYERHPKNYVRKRRKNGNTEKKIFVQ